MCVGYLREFKFLRKLMCFLCPHRERGKEIWFCWMLIPVILPSTSLLRSKHNENGTLGVSYYLFIFSLNCSRILRRYIWTNARTTTPPKSITRLQNVRRPTQAKSTNVKPHTRHFIVLVKMTLRELPCARLFAFGRLLATRFVHVKKIKIC